MGAEQWTVRHNSICKKEIGQAPTTATTIVSELDNANPSFFHFILGLFIKHDLEKELYSLYTGDFDGALLTVLQYVALG